MANSSRVSTWCIVRFFSCCLSLFAMDSASKPSAVTVSFCSSRTSCRSSSTSLMKSIRRKGSSSSGGGLKGPFFCYKIRHEQLFRNGIPRHMLYFNDTMSMLSISNPAGMTRLNGSSLGKVSTMSFLHSFSHSSLLCPSCMFRSSFSSLMAGEASRFKISI